MRIFRWSYSCRFLLLPIKKKNNSRFDKKSIIMSNDSLINLNITEIGILVQTSKCSNNFNYFIIPFEIIKDCSTYNPCGRYRYCRDDHKNEWSCVCKFWWKGTICDTCESHS